MGTDLGLELADAVGGAGEPVADFVEFAGVGEAAAQVSTITEFPN